MLLRKTLRLRQNSKQPTAKIRQLAKYLYHSLTTTTLLQSRRGGFNDEPRWCSSDVEGSLDQENEGNYCGALGFRRGIWEKGRNSGRDVAAGRARIASAQRARWAKVKAESKKGNVVTMLKKRTMSAAARRKIAAAQRARWAKVKAAKNTA